MHVLATKGRICLLGLLVRLLVVPTEMLNKCEMLKREQDNNKLDLSSSEGIKRSKASWSATVICMHCLVVILK